MVSAILCEEIFWHFSRKISYFEGNKQPIIPFLKKNAISDWVGEGRWMQRLYGSVGGGGKG
ncbi:MAG: hypothetical protein QNJ68_19400 [Microcoleaceae cyanobacterium MO_207.B10]|nr:hypothetical protein [Microcoleaceae cyanobacterium MO_207.B10]